ncbi:MAG: DUF2007 domain-containing protein [Bacteroidota bacterium]
MNDNTIILREFNDQYAALMVSDQLKSAGVECFLSNDNLYNNNQLIMVLPTIVYLHIFEKDLELANSILLEIEKPEGFDGDLL